MKKERLNLLPARMLLFNLTNNVGHSNDISCDSLLPPLLSISYNLLEDRNMYTLIHNHKFKNSRIHCRKLQLNSDCLKCSIFQLLGTNSSTIMTFS